MTDDPNRPWQTMDDLLALAVAHRASDLHLKSNRPPLLRIHGEVETVDGPPLAAQQILEMCLGIMNERARRHLEEAGAADFSHTLREGDRFRINVFRERGETAVAARRVQRFVASFDELHLPGDTMGRMCKVRHGLIVFSGTTGCGKSTSIASCLAYINETRACHIVTIEDPIEYLFEDNLAFINQREIGPDVPNYELALRFLLREDPDVVMVGELRDKMVVEAALRAAETTRLVFTTVHGGSAPGVITRILDWFTPEERPLIRESLASNLVAVIVQKLVPSCRPDVPRVPATEVLLSSPTIRKTIREGDNAHLGTIIQAENDQGMHDFTQDLARLIREEWVDPKVAYEMAPNAEALRLAIRGIAVKKGTIR
jgi:twitching motility protein PilT